MENKDHHQDQHLQARQSALIGLKIGCLTFFIGGAAILVGFLLDTRLGSYPRWTLILLIGTAPFVLGGVYRMVRRTVKKPDDEEMPADHDAEEHD